MIVLKFYSPNGLSEGIKMELSRLIKNAKKIVFFTGAGISAESGIPTFRGKDGLWNKYSPSELAGCVNNFV
ncbi:hypothetical protein BLW93_03060 [Desulfurobacterium indicum]|uniref:Uncharacterized protein n=1 Tax=Desulfurobacterium indicum TaxID=1914305 RepID=A0A1R1MM62_9BACT|nr:Sir2 family NAD-dependent protein deacetylase [Desulfurobacterium indicum]OMH40905.1 hypothetical protein BLW93_03060 [Desulfurobacterium indicum]